MGLPSRTAPRDDVLTKLTAILSGAHVSISRTVIDGWTHEGVAGSGPNSTPAYVLVTVLYQRALYLYLLKEASLDSYSFLCLQESLIRRCQQGIEAGYGNPQVTLNRIDPKIMLQ